MPSQPLAFLTVPAPRCNVRHMLRETQIWSRGIDDPHFNAACVLCLTTPMTLGDAQIHQPALNSSVCDHQRKD